MLKAKIAHTVTELTGKSFPTNYALLDEFIAKAIHTMHVTFTLIFDQFEEYFLYHPETEIDNRFDEEFARAVNNSSELGVNFLISIRENSLSLMDRFQRRIPMLFDNYLRIEHLDYEAARKAIEQPVKQYNSLHTRDGQQFSIERALVEAVLKQVRTGQVFLGETGRGIVGSEASIPAVKARIETPYLQLVMTRLWNKEVRDCSHILRLETLEDLGGAREIVRMHLNTAINSLSADEQDIVARVFRYLVTPSGTKIAHKVSDLSDLAGLQQAQLVTVLDKLSSGDNRILRPVITPFDQPNVPSYEIYHDVLAQPILDWQARYVHAQEQAKAAKQAAINAAEQEKEAARRREVKVLRLGLAGSVLFLLIIVGLATVAFQQRNIALRAQMEAEKQSRIAQKQTKLAEECQEETEGAKKKTIAIEKTDELNRGAFTHYQKGDREGALEKLKEALSLYQRSGNRAGEQMVLYNIGVIYQFEADYNTALINYEVALEIMRETGDKSMEGEVLT